MYDDVSPTDVMRGTWRWFPAAVTVIIAVLILGGLTTLVCWQAGWFRMKETGCRPSVT